MSQSLIQITPHTLFPKWAQMFDFVQELNKQDLEHSLWVSLISQKLKESNIDIGDSKFCVVGEAYKFSNNYDVNNSCKQCNHHACEFVSLFHNLKHGLIDNWRESGTVKNFITHFQIHS